VSAKSLRQALTSSPRLKSSPQVGNLHSPKSPNDPGALTASKSPTQKTQSLLFPFLISLRGFPFSIAQAFSLIEPATRFEHESIGSNEAPQQFSNAAVSASPEEAYPIRSYEPPRHRPIGSGPWLNLKNRQQASSRPTLPPRRHAAAVNSVTHRTDLPICLLQNRETKAHDNDIATRASPAI
jgi:hypothetical protein